MKLIAQLLIALCCAALCACSRGRRVVKPEDVLLYKKFLFEATAFDYCGCSYSDDDVEIAARGYGDDDVFRYYLSEHGHEHESIAFFRLVNEVEKDARGNGSSMTWDTVDRLKVALMRQKRLSRSRSERFSVFCYERNLMRLLYSVARVVEASRHSSDFSKDFVFRVLPDELFEIDLSGCDWVVVGEDWLLGARAFRDLLLASCRLDVAGGDKGWALSSLKDEHVRNLASGGSFRMLGDHEKWVMVLGDRRRMKLNRISMNSFHCPQIERDGPVFLTSDYSRRRERIFREGEEGDGRVVFVRRGRITVEKKKKRVASSL